MRKCVGNIAFEGKRLQYYVFGNSKTGFGIEIVETKIERANQLVSGGLEPALSLAKKLRRRTVFPENLNEIVEDFES